MGRCAAMGGGQGLRGPNRPTQASILADCQMIGVPFAESHPPGTAHGTTECMISYRPFHHKGKSITAKRPERKSYALFLGYFLAILSCVVTSEMHRP